MYFSKLLYTLNCKTDMNTLIENIVNPFSPYFLCQHFIGVQAKEYNIVIPDDINDILITNNIDIIQDYDIVFVENNYFDLFLNAYLPNIKSKFVLITGQWCLPGIKRNSYTDQLLEHSKILLWISQNPVYENNPKYMAFPYGIKHTALGVYASMLLYRNIDKSNEILLTGLNRLTNICRLKLPIRDNVCIPEFYENIAKSKFVISPIGDRDDCYRHYESIGLGAIPISNVSHEYKAIFGKNMYYCDIEKMVDIVSNDKIDCEYIVPNRDLVCFDYYKDMVIDRINRIKQEASVITSS